MEWFSLSKSVFLGYFELFGAIQLFWVIPGYFGLFWSSSGYFGYYELVWAILDYIGLFWAIFGYFELFGVLFSYHHQYYIIYFLFILNITSKAHNFLCQLWNFRYKWDFSNNLKVKVKESLANGSSSSFKWTDQEVFRGTIKSHSSVLNNLNPNIKTLAHIRNLKIIPLSWVRGKRVYDWSIGANCIRFNKSSIK